MKPKVGRLHEMVLLILIIGMFNIYDILKNINISVYDVININEKNILYLVTLTLFFTASLLFFKSKNNTALALDSLEFELILGLGLIGLYFILLANDLLLFFLALELYSLSVYLLLFKNNKDKERKITILYFLLGSISSSFILLAIALLYNSTGSLDMKYIFQNIDIIASYTTESGGKNTQLKVGLALFFGGLLFKIGSAPFQFWVIRVYTQMDLKILMYQSIVPKIAYIYLLSALADFIKYPGDIPGEVEKLLLLSAFLSLFIGPIGAISKGVNKFKKLIAYSSILHVGYLLLGLVANTHSSPLAVNGPIYDWWGGSTIYLNIFQYLLIYGLNTLQFGLAFFFLQFFLLPPFSQDSNTTRKSSPVGLNKPLLLLFFLISIFSFIGLPPFGGFYAKLNIVLNCFYTNNELLQFFAILFIIFSTLIAAFLYLKFFNFLFFTPFKMDPTLSNGGFSQPSPKVMGGFESPIFNPLGVGVAVQGWGAYLLSFLSLFLLVYPIYLPYLTPIFELFSTI